MADKNPLTPEEVTELFSEIDASGVLDPTLAKKRTERMREKEAAAKRGDKAALAQLRSEDRASQAKHIDPLSEDDPSGSQVSHTITKTAMAVVIGILVLIVGMQIGYGVMRRLNTPTCPRAFRSIPFRPRSRVDLNGATALRSSRSTSPSMKPMNARARSR